VLNLKILHLRKLLLFAGLSLADLVLTWLLVRRSNGTVYEGNPVAGWWLNHHGWLGLAVFKGGIVLLVAVLTLLISRSRPRFGGLLLGFACSIVAGVLVYSVTLASLEKGREEAEKKAEAAAEEQLAARLDMGWEYRHLMDRLTEDLIAGRRSLDDAAVRLGSSRKGQDATWLRLLHARFPCRTNTECLATNLVVQAVATLKDNPAAARTVAQRLAEEYRSSYGVPLPCPDDSLLAVVLPDPAQETRPAVPPDRTWPHRPGHRPPMSRSAP
jgi:hypothetical protein